MPDKLLVTGCRVQYCAYFYSRKKERLVRYVSHFLPHTLSKKNLAAFIVSATEHVVPHCNAQFGVDDFKLMTDQEVEAVLDNAQLEDYGHA